MAVIAAARRAVMPTSVMFSPSEDLNMTRSVPAIVTALLLTAIATPVFAQAAIQEPGLYSFYHPNGDVLHAGSSYRPLDANAYYNVATPAPQVRQHAAAPRHRRVVQ
jgi:D-alanyl-D-alanine dipeptidase